GQAGDPAANVGVSGAPKGERSKCPGHQQHICNSQDRDDIVLSTLPEKFVTIAERGPNQEMPTKEQACRPRSVAATPYLALECKRGDHGSNPHRSRATRFGR